MAAHAKASPGGFHPHLPGAGHRWLAKALGASMWFFIFYRARKDGPALIGLRHPWEGHGHAHGHDDGHNEQPGGIHRSGPGIL